MTRSGANSQIIQTVLGGLALVALWEIAGRMKWGGATLPSLSDVLSFAVMPRNITLLFDSALVTLSSASTGFCFGIVIGLTAAFLGNVFPKADEPIGQGTALLNAIPSIALGPIFTIALSPQLAPIAIAAISSTFPIYVNASSGLASAHGRYIDLARVYGTNPVRRLFMIQFPHAFPAIATGLKAAAPAALIGSIVGEWFGASRGLGILMVSSMQNFQIPLLWSAVSVTLVVSLSTFGFFSWVEQGIGRKYV